MTYCSELTALCELAGYRLEALPNGHCKIHGALLVNYYPLSAAKTAYVAGTTKGKKHVTPMQAVEMAGSEPEVVDRAVKDSRNKKSRKLRLRMLKGQKTCKCHWCPTIIDIDTSTLEHVIPLHRGGLDNANNRVLACGPCNSARGNSMPELKRKK